MNYESQNRLFKKHQIRNLLRIFILLGFLLSIIRLENFLYATEDYCCYPDQDNNELVISEQPTENLILTDDNDYSEYREGITAHVHETSIFHSYTTAINSFNYLISLKFKTISFDHLFCSNIISILQKNNIWHKSSEERPVIAG